MFYTDFTFNFLFILAKGTFINFFKFSSCKELGVVGEGNIFSLFEAWGCFDPLKGFVSSLD